MKTIATIYWTDATCHGNETHTDEEAKKQGLIKGVAVGIIVHEDKKQITVATDHFPEWNTWRTLSSYPKSGIQKIKRTKIKVEKDKEE